MHPNPKLFHRSGQTKRKTISLLCKPCIKKSIICSGFVSLMLTRSYCCSLVGYLHSAEAPVKSACKSKNQADCLTQLIKLGSSVQILNERLAKGSHIPHSPVISSISREARVSYLCCVALTLPLGKSISLRARCEATVEKKAVRHSYHEVQSVEGIIFLRISP